LRAVWTLSLSFVGALWGLVVGVGLAGLDALLSGVLCGAALGAVTARASFPALCRFVEWADKLARANRAFGPPPRKVLLLGAALGAAEGVVVGAFHGQVAGAILGAYCGGIFGTGIAGLSWQVRRHTALVALGLLLGALIELGGCLLLGHLVARMARETVLAIMFGISAVTGLAMRGVRAIRLRCLRPGRLDRDAGPERAVQEMRILRCEECAEAATVHITEARDGAALSERHLCAVHARAYLGELSASGTD
jgi:hypothetical protein